MCCQPDPPVLPTGSVVRISTTRPEGSLTSASVIASDHSVRTPLLSEGLGDTKPVILVTHRLSESGDLLCSDGNPASGLLPLLIQPFIGAGCRGVVPSPFSARPLAKSSSTAPHLFSLTCGRGLLFTVHCNLMITLL